MKLFIISGTSGAGKSIALNALEDIGFYSIDNLPISLLPSFARELAQNSNHTYDNAVVGIDARNLVGSMESFSQVLDELKEIGIESEIIFLDADDGTLIKRFSETRRRHPLADSQRPLEDAIREERTYLKPIADQADLKLNTSHSNVHQLRNLVQDRLGSSGDDAMSILFQSFGFKHGIPAEADFIFDMRCLPNPHWEAELRPLTGNDEAVAHFLENHFEVNRMFEQISDFLTEWLPRFEADRRKYMTIAIGCTGGQHRSVYFVERLAEHFRLAGSQVLIRHRELP